MKTSVSKTISYALVGIIVLQACCLAYIFLGQSRRNSLLEATRAEQKAHKLRIASLTRQIEQKGSQLASPNIRDGLLVAPDAERQRADVLPVIAEIKARYATNPPPVPRKAPPESKEWDGRTFLELLDNAEYRENFIRANVMLHIVNNRDYLMDSGVSPDMRQKFLRLLSEQQLDRYDLVRANPAASSSVFAGGRVVGLFNELRGGATGDGSSGQTASDKLREQHENAIRDLLGDDAYKQYYESKGMLAGFSFDIAQLDERLSYTDTPLLQEQWKKLMSYDKGTPISVSMVDGWNDYALAVLTAEQWKAVEEMKKEGQARMALYQLPASSALPPRPLQKPPPAGK